MERLSIVLALVLFTASVTCGLEAAIKRRITFKPFWIPCTWLSDGGQCCFDHFVRADVYSFVFVWFTDMINGRIGDMVEMGVTESYQVKKQVLVSAAEAAEMIVRVDNIVKAAPR